MGSKSQKVIDSEKIVFKMIHIYTHKLIKGNGSISHCLDSTFNVHMW